MKNFRCFTKKIVNFNESMTLIEGHNGNGKTSVLEALYYSCYLRSFRTSSPKEMLTFGTDNFFIKIDVETYQESTMLTRQVQIGFHEGKRRVKVDGKAISSYKELMSCLRVISLTEDDMHLIKGAPSERRLFMDHAIVLENDGYAHQLNILRNIVLTRNNILKQPGAIRTHNYQIITEQLWDQSLIIQKARMVYSSDLEQEINNLIKLFFNDESYINLNYLPKKTMYDCFGTFLESCHSLFDLESRVQRSCFGAQLDDLVIIYNTLGSRHFASRGQQKMILLLIKIAQIILLQKNGCQSAILFLLDDYMTDFDDFRAMTLLKILKSLNVQLVFTTPTTNGVLGVKTIELDSAFSIISL